MKKVMLILLAALLVLALFACGKAPAPVSSQEAAPTKAPDPVQEGKPAQTKIENKVPLSLDKSAYAQEEIIEVTLDFGALDQSAAVIAIVPADREHGSEMAANQAHQEYGYEYRYLSDFSEIPFYLWAPEADGLFDVRLYAKSEGGEELAYLTIAVGNAKLPEG